MDLHVLHVHVCTCTCLNCCGGGWCCGARMFMYVFYLFFFFSCALYCGARQVIIHVYSQLCFPCVSPDYTNDLWGMEQRQKQDKHQLLKQELREAFHMQRHQMHSRHQKVSSSSGNYNLWQLICHCSFEIWKDSTV